MIGAEEEFQALRGGSIQDPSWGFLSEMRDLGHAAAGRWLEENLPAVGSHSARFGPLRRAGGQGRLRPPRHP